MLVVALVCGTAMGVATWLAMRALAPTRPDLAAALTDLERPRPPSPSGVRVAPRSPRRVVVARLARLAAAAGPAPDTRLAIDLELAGRSYERHVLQKVLGSAYGLVLPVAAALAFTAAGVDVPVAAVVVACALLAGGGFFLPDLLARAQGEELRRDFDHALALYLELVALLLAGGAGIETSLSEAAEAGDGWAYQRLRAALASARLKGETPWQSFANTGARSRLPALEELAASVTLAGEQGAPVRQSLIAKARSLREHEIRRAEADAEAASERMTIPLVMLLFAFVVFIGYPAIERVIGSL